MGYPDISLLAKLAACLDVPPGELLAGARDTAPAPAAEQAVETTLKYAQTVTRRRHISVTRVILGLLTLACLWAIIICMICDFSLNGRFTWVVFPASSILFGWLAVAPALYFQHARLTMSLTSVSIFILPFLLVLAYATGGGWFFPVAVPCALSGLAWLWILRFSFTASQGGKLFTAGVGVCLLPLVDLSVGLAIWGYTKEPQLDFWDGLSSVLCLIIGLLMILRGRKHAIG